MAWDPVLALRAATLIDRVTKVVEKVEFFAAEA
jgi:hypothetical protein